MSQMRFVHRSYVQRSPIVAAIVWRHNEEQVQKLCKYFKETVAIPGIYYPVIALPCRRRTMVMLHQPRVTGNKHSTGRAHLVSMIKLRRLPVGGMLLVDLVGEESGEGRRMGRMVGVQ